MGAAIESFVIGLSIAGFVAIVALVFGFFGRVNERFPSIKITRRKPILLAALLFSTTWFLLWYSESLSISGYRGVNSVQHHFVGNASYRFNIYSGQQYTNTINFKVESNLEINEVLIVCIRFYDCDVGNLVHSKSINITPNDTDEELESVEEPFEIPSGHYTVNLTTSFIQIGYGNVESRWVYIKLSQRLGPNHIEELLHWNVLFFFILIINFVFITAGLYIDMDSAEKLDESGSKESSGDEKSLKKSYDEYLDMIK